MDAAEGMKKTIAERKKLMNEKVRLMKHTHLNLDSIRRRRKAEQHPQQ